MCRIFLAAVMGLLASALFVPRSAFAECPIWDLNGHWVFRQIGTNLNVGFDLRQDPAGEIQGEALYVTEGNFGGVYEGSVQGRTNGNKFTFVVDWGGSKGEYTGNVNTDGTVWGNTRDLGRGNLDAWSERDNKRARCMAVTTPPSVALDNYTEGVNLPGSDYRGFETTKGADAECSVACGNDPQCKSWTWTKPGNQAPKGKCWLKNAVPGAVPNDCCISGLRSKAIKVLGKVIKAIGPARVDHDVEIFDKVEQPRNVLGDMLAGGKGRAVERHPHGWCRLEAIDKTNPPGIVGWIAEDHLTTGKCPVN
jgi:hypothetical protein